MEDYITRSERAKVFIQKNPGPAKVVPFRYKEMSLCTGSSEWNGGVYIALRSVFIRITRL